MTVADDGDVISGGVRAGVAAAQQHRHRLSGPGLAVVDERGQRVMPIAVLERRRGVFLVRVRGHQSGVDVEDQRPAVIDPVIRSGGPIRVGDHERHAGEVRPSRALIQALNDCRVAFAPLTSTDMIRPTCCPAWSVRDVLNHVTATVSKFADFAEGATDRPVTPSGDLLGSDPSRSFAATAARAADVWRLTDGSRQCHLPFGTYSAEQAAGINLFDLLAHQSDIALATAAPITSAADVWRTALDIAREVVGGTERDTNHYAPQHAAALDAPVWEQLRTYLGRAPSRTIWGPHDPFAG